MIFYFLLRLSSGISTTTTRLQNWFSNLKKRKAHLKTISGLYDLVEGRWGSAEKKLLRSAKHSDMPLVNYLASAFMAQNQHAFRRRNSYLRLAQKVAKDRPIAVGLAQASLQIGNKQWEEAAATLQKLHQVQPKNVFILQLLQQAYLELKDWYRLEKLLPLLRKRKAIKDNIINRLEEKIYQELLLLELKNKNITATWKHLPRYLQKNPKTAAIYVKYLSTNNQSKEAETILKTALHKNLDSQLLELYAMLPDVDHIKQLRRAEGWLKKHPENFALLLALGKICHKQKLWGKALHYLEKSATIHPTADVYVELAQIMVEQGDLEGAIKFYVQGASFPKTI